MDRSGRRVFALLARQGPVKLGACMHNNYRGLAFLLSIGSLPLACTKETNDTDGDDSTTASTAPNATTGTGTDATDPTQATDPTSTGGTTTTGPQDPTDPTEPQQTSFLTSDSETADTGFETDDTGAPPATDPTCIAYGAHITECFPRSAGYENYYAKDCEYTKMYGMIDGDDCVQAIEMFYVCVSMADCAELGPEEPTACQKELAAAEAVCPSLGDTDTDTDGDTGPDSTSG